MTVLETKLKDSLDASLSLTQHAMNVTQSHLLYLLSTIRTHPTTTVLDKTSLFSLLDNCKSFLVSLSRYTYDPFQSQNDLGDNTDYATSSLG